MGAKLVDDDKLIFAKIEKNSNYNNNNAMYIDGDSIRLGRDSESILSARQQHARLDY